ncbi:MAG: ABC transporter ATP-binding protein [Planctomycetales bacterium]|nr:ABC transporter ATP-binding protein [Planctomycetales bacterium]
MKIDSPIQFQNVCKRFRDTFALDNVSLEVTPGQVFALLGENGAGKTTSIKIMMGMLDADSGKSRILGLDSQREHLAIRQQVGYVSDQPSLYEWMSVEHIGWFASGFYPNGYKDEFDRLVGQYGLDAKKKIKSLSKGMRAKVALSLALAHQPSLLILDEPTSGLDTLVRRDFLESMVDIAAEGRTVFLSSHQIPEVERVADTIAIISKGKLLVVESMDRLKRTTSQVIITTSGELPRLALPDIIYQEKQGRQIRCVVRHDDDLDLSSIADNPLVQGLEVIRPSLEEIYVAYMRSTGSPASSANTNAVLDAKEINS